MSSQRLMAFGLRFYVVVFFGYLFLPLIIMAAATFNDSRFPTVTPWGGTTLRWFGELAADGSMWQALANSAIVALGVLVVAVPIGIATALFLNTVSSRAKPFLYALILSPLLTPGVIIGISTLIFWRQFGVSGGIFLTVLGQATFIAAYVMLMVTARLQRFDRTMERAALDLGASQWQMFRRILLPYLKPAILSAAVIAFLQSFENYNTTLFVVGYDTTLTVYIASKVRTGLTPAVNALGLILILVTVLLAVVYEVKRRRELTAQAAAREVAREA
ncbi:ABC transporter permease [Halomonas urumqiensis]|uniref:ABC transporter permease n=1 Tax=Halomonas urumqiensis TaxID=1684789 RepID=A0A2N7UD29_9GAMM|nr:ABC transporter permease [Halomonas urumqiensis]PMR78343.1 ABC transporter permease [Halomonas urumqiensis]PTB03490.1 ABC transporter permease [Halomonas urumqiensis]GHE20323.1 peptide ABC transporter permease [Halomonas urumqiensis]